MSEDFESQLRRADRFLSQQMIVPAVLLAVTSVGWLYFGKLLEAGQSAVFAVIAFTWWKQSRSQ